MARTEGSPKPALSCARIHRAGGPINLSRHEEGRTPPAAVAQPAPRRTSLQSSKCCSRSTLWRAATSPRLTTARSKSSWPLQAQIAPNRIKSEPSRWVAVHRIPKPVAPAPERGKCPPMTPCNPDALPTRRWRRRDRPNRDWCIGYREGSPCDCAVGSEAIDAVRQAFFPHRRQA